MKANRKSATPGSDWANEEAVPREMNVILDFVRPNSRFDPGPELHTTGATRATGSIVRQNAWLDHVHEPLAVRSFGQPFASAERPGHGFASSQTRYGSGAAEEQGRYPGIARRGLSRRTLALALTYMEDNIGRNFRIEELARAVGISRSHFSRLFRTSTGKSPMGYLQCLRVNRAKALLLQSDRSICDIAVSLGFFDQSHFTRTFRRFTALAPREYVRMYDVAEVAV